MEPLAIFVLSLSILFFSEAQAAKFTIRNHCPYTVWPGTLSSAGPQPSSTGFELAPKASSTLDIAAPWTGRFWARTGCTTDATGKFKCATADCASGQVQCNGAGAIPPASLVEFTLAGYAGQDFYDVSLVDGFNLPMSVTPHGGLRRCPSTSCPGNINSVCPRRLAIEGSHGRVIGCKSACLAFNQPQYCCTGDHATPDKCPPTNYSKIFKNKCPQAYSYAYDDKTSTFTCPSGASYIVTFCPLSVVKLAI